MKTGVMSMQTATQELLSTKDVARLFSVSKQTVRAWMREGKLPFMQVGQVIRVRREDVQEFIARNERERQEQA
ncbi:MAG: helix-turn-helix domain-containing protein [Candidatus Sulfotelmatobacter sp.]